MPSFASRFAPLSAAPALLVFLAACAPAPADDTGGHAHVGEDEHEHPAAVITVWEQGFELYYEIPAPVVDEPFELPLHVTRIADGAPRELGSLSLTWRAAAGVERRQVQEQPTSPGLYLTEVMLDKVGTWGLSVEVPVPEGSVLIELPPVRVFPTEQEAELAVLPGAPEGVTFLKEQQWLLGVRTEQVSERQLAQRLVVPGRVEPVPTRRGVVSPTLSGRLEAPSSGAIPALGARVEAGAVVGFIRPPWSELSLRVQEARAERRAAEVDLARVERAYERVAELHERSARSDRELEEAGFERDAARARDESARAIVAALGELGASLGDGDESMPRFALTAPVGGVVQAVGASLGESLEPGEMILELLDTSHVYVVAQPSPEQLAQTNPKLPPRWSRHGSTDGSTELELEDARLVLVAGAITEPGHTVPVVYEVENPDGELLVGELVEVGLSTGAERLVLALPTTALVDDAGQPTAFVQVSGEVFERRDLEIGASSDGFVEVLRGLEPGDRVVTNRPYAIRLAGASGTVPVHSH